MGTLDIDEADEPLLTSTEIAARYRVTQSAIAKWARNGTLPTAHRLPGGARRFRLSDVERLFAPLNDDKPDDDEVAS
jgi:excisionase family DNA binding protein